MGKIYLLCGKICSGKTCYARQLKEKYGAVILSMDELTCALINNEQGSFYDAFTRKAGLYLRSIAAETAAAGANVILDWGFWTRESRAEMSDFLNRSDVPYEWHYVDVPDALWQANITERNSRVLAGNGGADFFVDEGLLNKLLSLFDAPARAEMDVWYTPSR